MDEFETVSKRYKQKLVTIVYKRKFWAKKKTLHTVPIKNTLHAPDLILNTLLGQTYYFLMLKPEG